MNSGPFATVALAGRSIAGGWCQCGCYACICGEGEEAMICPNSTGAVSDGVEDQAVASSGDYGFGFDFGSGAMLVALALFAWSRFRASGF